MSAGILLGSSGGKVPGLIQSDAEHATAERIAELIEKLINTNVTRAALMMEIDQQFPGISYRVFLFALTLFEVRRTCAGRWQ
jgi:hypothetical protein